MYNHSSFNQAGGSYGQDNAKPLSNLFDLRSEKLKSSRLNGYNNRFEDYSCNSYSGRQESFKEFYEHSTSDREEKLLPSLNQQIKYSPAWDFLKQFNSPNGEKVNSQKKTFFDLFDLPNNNKVETALGNRDSNEHSFNTDAQSFNYNLFPKRDSNSIFGFYGQKKAINDFTSTNSQKSLHRVWQMNGCVNQISGADNMLPSSHIGNRINKSIPSGFHGQTKVFNDFTPTNVQKPFYGSWETNGVINKRKVADNMLSSFHFGYRINKAKLSSELGERIHKRGSYMNKRKRFKNKKKVKLIHNSSVA